MQSKNHAKIRRWSAAACVLASLAGHPLPVAAQEMLQLVVPREEYTLGRFKYRSPRTDGWRQMANSTSSLSLVYAEQQGEDKIDTKFGAALEVHDIPPTVQVESAAALAELSRKQMSEQHKENLVSADPIKPVPSIDNLYTYRLLVHSPIKGDVDAYEVYYVAMAPDKTQYIVIQCITKTPAYENELYFTEFYASLVSLKYDAAAAAASPPANTAPAAPATAPAAPATAPAAPATPPAAPATPPAAPATPPAAPETH